MCLQSAVRSFPISWLHKFSTSHLNWLPVKHRSIWWTVSNGAAILSQESSHWLHTIWPILWMCSVRSGNSYWMDLWRVQKTAPGIYGINIKNWNTWQHERQPKNETSPKLQKVAVLFSPRLWNLYSQCYPHTSNCSLQETGVPLFLDSVWIVSQLCN